MTTREKIVRLGNRVKSMTRAQIANRTGKTYKDVVCTFCNHHDLPRPRLGKRGRPKK